MAKTPQTNTEVERRAADRPIEGNDISEPLIVKKWKYASTSPISSTIITIVAPVVSGVAIFSLTESKDPTAGDVVKLVAALGASMITAILATGLFDRGMIETQKDALEKQGELIDRQNERIRSLTASLSQEREALSNDFANLKSALLAAAVRSKTFQIQGKTRELGRAFWDRFADAVDVRNTYIDIVDPLSSDHDTAAEGYTKWLTNSLGGAWEDVVGVREFFSERYSHIPPLQGYAGKHRIFVLRHGVPTINFLILKYAGKRPDEVFFGWLPEDDEHKSTIFSSSDPSVIGMYESYFTILKDHSWNSYFPRDTAVDYDTKMGYRLDYSKSGPDRFRAISPKLVDKRGLWTTLSYAKSDGEEAWSANRLGFVNISPSSRGISVSAKIWSTSGRFEEGETEHREISHYLDTIFISYRLEGSGHTGICMYKFLRKAYGEVLLGVYMDRRDQYRNTIIGCRCDEFDGIGAVKLNRGDVRAWVEKLDGEFRAYHDFDSIVSGPDTMP